MSKKNPGVPNIERVRAENERRRSSAAQPQESRNKRERTRERSVAAELRREGRGNRLDPLALVHGVL